MKKKDKKALKFCIPFLNETNNICLDNIKITLVLQAPYEKEEVNFKKKSITEALVSKKTLRILIKLIDQIFEEDTEYLQLTWDYALKIEST